jgi:hypothetical protein
MATRMTRSRFLAALATGLVLPVVVPRKLLGWTPQRRLDRAAGADTFRLLLNSVFRVRSPFGLTRELVLTRVTTHPLSPGTEQFTLEFSSSDGPALEEGTYPALHPELGQFQLFLSPVSEDAESGRSVYRADFNLLR